MAQHAVRAVACTSQYMLVDGVQRALGGCGRLLAVVSGGSDWLRLLAASLRLQGVNVQRWPVRCDPERGVGEHGDMRRAD